MDSITINSLELKTHIGVPDAERVKEQKLFVTVELFLDTKEAAEADDVTKSIDYESVANDIQELGKTERKTVERLAEDTAQMILQKYKPESVKITIVKNALPDTKGICITIMRP